MLAAALVAVGMVAQAQSDQRVDLNLKDAPMKAAIEVLMRQTGISVVFESTDIAFPEVTLSLPGVTAEEGLRYICQAAGVYYKKDDAGVYIISRNKPEEKPVVNVKTPAIKVPKKLYRLRLQKADAETVFKFVTQGVVEIDPTSEFKALNRFTDEMSPMRRFQQLADRNDAFDYGFDKGTAKPVQTNNPGIRTNLDGNGISLPDDFAGQGGLGGGAGLGGGQGAPGGRQGPGGGGQGGQGGGLSASGLISDDISYIVYDPIDNSIVIQATEQQYREIQGYVDTFDQAPKQVTVKVQFVTLSSSVSRSLGFDWLYTRGTTVAGNNPGSFAQSSDPIFIAYQTGNIQTRLRTFIQDGYGQVVSSPSVRTLNNMPAQVLQGTITTIFLPRVTGVTQGVAQTVYDPYPLQLISSLVLKPRINNDGTVTVYLTPSITQPGQVRTSPDGINVIPDILVQQLSVAARVKSGETIVLAGFTSKSDQGINKKFPVLGDLPIIGQLFRSSTKEKTTSELLIFVTPTIEEDDESGD